MLTVLVVLIVSVTIFVVLLRAGKRLSPLTAERAKAAVPFGGLPSTRATAWTDSGQRRGAEQICGSATALATRLGGCDLPIAELAR